jgi:hypothetical protein
MILGERLDQVAAEPIITRGPVEAFDVSVLLRFTLLDECRDKHRLRPHSAMRLPAYSDPSDGFGVLACYTPVPGTSFVSAGKSGGGM